MHSSHVSLWKTVIHNCTEWPSSASESSEFMALYKLFYLLTYSLTYLRTYMKYCNQYCIARLPIGCMLIVYVAEWLRSPPLMRKGLGSTPRAGKLDSGYHPSEEQQLLNSGWLLLKIANVNRRSRKSAGPASLTMWNFISPVGLRRLETDMNTAPKIWVLYYSWSAEFTCVYELTNPFASRKHARGKRNVTQ